MISPAFRKKQALKENPLDIGFDAIEQYPYPVLAMIDGFALGAGCELAMTCRYKDRLGKINDEMRPPPRGGLSSQGGTKIINVMGMANAMEAFSGALL